MFRRFPLSLLTHAAALAAGLALFGPSGLFARHDTASTAPSPAKPAPQTKSGPRDSAAANTTWSAAEILRQVDQGPPIAMASSSYDQEEATSSKAMREELAKSGQDARSVFDCELAEYLGTLKQDGPQSLPLRLHTLVRLMAETQEPLALAGYFGKSGPLDYALLKPIATAFARDASAANLRELKAVIPPDHWDMGSWNIVRAWPDDRHDELLQWALAENKLSMLGQARDESSRGLWLTGLMTDESLPEEIRARLKADPQIANLVAGSPQVPVATRLEAAPARTARELGVQDLDPLFHDPRDWAYRFQTGQAAPAEILAAAANASPELAATNPADLRQALYAKLAETDPARALTLLDDLSPDQRSAAILSASLTSAFAAKPDQFLAMLSEVPYTPETRDQRLLAWQQRTEFYLQISPGDYLNWLDRLPPGADRDMALSGAAARLQRDQPAQAAELRTRIADPALRQNSLIPLR